MKWRLLKDKIFKYSVILFAFAVFIPLALILFDLVSKGIGAINLEFFTKLPKPPGEEGGGILNAIAGTFILISLATLMAVPFGIMTGIFIVDFKKSKTAKFASFSVNLLQGIPSIVLGIIAYVWVVLPSGRFSAFSGAVALAIMMLPIIIKSTEETLKMIPDYLKEASYSLGAGYTRTLFEVVLPAALPSIASGVLISISRIAGETAPLLFTAFGNPFLNLNALKPVDSMPLVIFKYAMSPYDDWHRIAWGASFVLILFILVMNLLTKFYFSKKRVKL